MPNKSTSYLILLTALLAAYTIWNYSGKSNQGMIKLNSKAIPVKGIDSIDEIEISSASGKVSLSRTSEEEWNITHPVTDRANTKKIENILAELTELKKFDSISSKNAPSSSEMGLTESSLSVKLLSDNNFIGKIILGNATGITDTIYAQWNDKNKEGTPFFCWSDIKEVIDVPYDKIRDKKLVNIPVEEIRKIEINDQSGSSLNVDKTAGEKSWLITKPLKTNTDDGNFNEWLSTIINLTSQEFIDKANSKIAAAFTTIPKTISILTNEEGGGSIIEFAKSDNGTTILAKVSDRPGVIFQIDKKAFDSINLNPNTIRNQRLLPFNPKSVVAFDLVAMPNNRVNLIQDNNGWQIIDNAQKIKADDQKMFKILKTLSAEQVEKFVADAAGDLKPWGLDQPTLSITIKSVALDPQKPTKKNGSPNIIDVNRKLLVKGQLAKDQDVIEYYATVEGSGTVAKLSPAFPSILPIRTLDYKELYLWPPFDLANLQSINTSKPPQTSLDLQYKYQSNEWSATLANENISKQINTIQALKLAQHLSLPIRATRWLSKNTGEAEIALLNPCRKIEFTLVDGNENTHPFKIELAPISKQASNILYYARINDNREICLIDRENFDVLDMPIIREFSEK
ncbi:MAG: DUF4340 domain-containing protein [Verrucomicrobiota bacterium]|nr:DUF4340 domain-containing protein [Verrucomicrobiota bacterium]